MGIWREGGIGTYQIRASSRSQPIPAVGSIIYICLLHSQVRNGIDAFKMAGTYPNRQPEHIPGKALKEYNIPRENVVIMTRVCLPLRQHVFIDCSLGTTWVFFVVPEDGGGADELGSVNCHGLSRKVNQLSLRPVMDFRVWISPRRVGVSEGRLGKTLHRRFALSRA